MTGIRLRIRLVAALAAVLLLGAACANDDGTEPSGGDTGSGGTTAATGATGATGDTMGGGGKDTAGYGDAGGGEDDSEGDGAAEGEITLQANNYAFDPAEIEVRSGEEISVKNGNANTPHTFTVDGTDIDLELSPLDVEDTTIDLEPGSYAFHCRFHAQMTGTMTVT